MGRLMEYYQTGFVVWLLELDIETKYVHDLKLMTGLIWGDIRRNKWIGIQLCPSQSRRKSRLLNGDYLDAEIRDERE